MLNDTPRKQLLALYAENEKVAENDKLCEAYLRDDCGEYRREIAALVGGVRWGIPKALRDMPNVPHGTLRANLARRLEENCGLSEDASLWAVDSWASIVRPQDNGLWMKAPEPEVAPVVDWSHRVEEPKKQAVQPGMPPLKPISQPKVAPVQAGVGEHVDRPSPPRVATAIPFAEAANAFVNGEKSNDLKAVQEYIKKQLKVRKQATLVEELRAAGVATGIAKDMVNKVRRKAAGRGLALGVLMFIAAIVLLGVAGNSRPASGGLAVFSFLMLIAGGLYILYSGFRLIRFS